MSIILNITKPTKREIYFTKYISQQKYILLNIYSYTNYTHRGYLKLNRNQFEYNTTTWNINTKKFLNRMEYKKENYNLKIENENIPTKPKQ